MIQTCCIIYYLINILFAIIMVLWSGKITVKSNYHFLSMNFYFDIDFDVLCSIRNQTSGKCLKHSQSEFSQLFIVYIYDNIERKNKPQVLHSVLLLTYYHHVTLIITIHYYFSLFPFIFFRMPSNFKFCVDIIIYDNTLPTDRCTILIPVFVLRHYSLALTTLILQYFFLRSRISS